ncbi:MAG: thioredoxin family protein [Anaerolineae bacterium]|nr:thioredoxin family protein [Anaerolineae bacterium]
MPLMDEKTQNEVREILSVLGKPVKLLVFTQEFECHYCKDTRELIEEVAALSDRITVEVRNFVTDKAVADAYKVDKIPAVTVLGEDDMDYGIRFYGIPAGYEFSSLLESIKMVGTGESALSEATLAFLDDLEEPLDLQVFVTPTCPYCPRAVVLAHYMAMASDKVTAAMVEATEFPHLSNLYHVMGVPRTVINRDPAHYIEGGLPEPMFVARVQDALG